MYGINIKTNNNLLANLIINEQDIQYFLKKFQSLQNSSLAKIPNVKWEDIGGLNHVKKDILDTIELPLRHPELFVQGMTKTFWYFIIWSTRYSPNLIS